MNKQSVKTLDFYIMITFTPQKYNAWSLWREREESIHPSREDRGELAKDQFLVTASLMDEF